MIVIKCYEEGSDKLKKYFKERLESKTLKYLNVLSQEAKAEAIDEMRKKWKYLAQKFTNVMEGTDVDALMRELVKYKMVDDCEGLEVDEWWAKIADMKEASTENELFPQLSKLALCTLYNSSSEAERDFSSQNFITSNPRKGRMGALKLRSLLQVRSAMGHLSTKCGLCTKAEQLKKEELRKGNKPAPYQVQHCHCQMLELNQDMMKEMRGGLPSQKYHADDKKHVEESEKLEIEREQNRKNDKEKYARILQLEKTRFVNKSKPTSATMSKKRGHLATLAKPNHKAKQSKLTLFSVKPKSQ